MHAPHKSKTNTALTVGLSLQIIGVIVAGLGLPLAGALGLLSAVGVPVLILMPDEAPGTPA